MCSFKECVGTWGLCRLGAMIVHYYYYFSPPLIYIHASNTISFPPLSLHLPTYVGGSVGESVCVLSLCLLTSMVEKIVKCISWTFSPHYYEL